MCTCGDDGLVTCMSKTYCEGLYQKSLNVELCYWSHAATQSTFWTNTGIPLIHVCLTLSLCLIEANLTSNRKAMNRNWSNQKANPALKTKTGNK